MCGIAGVFGSGWDESQLSKMVNSLQHRGPDAEGVFIDPTRIAGLGHRRLSIIDLTEAGNQPLSDETGRYVLIYNGEIYNYLELREELRSFYHFRSKTDSEVLLAAYLKWGEACLDRFIGMFAFIIWDTKTKTLFAARDRFGVKPFYYAISQDSVLYVASEIKALHAAGIPRIPNESVWASYLTNGIYDHSSQTFWANVLKLLPGCSMTWSNGDVKIKRWYDLYERVGDSVDNSSLEVVKKDYTALLEESVRLRFRSDVPVGINLSGGLDSAVLFRLVQNIHGDSGDIKVFTFITGDSYYDELPWVNKILAGSSYPIFTCLLQPSEIPVIAENVSASQDEPFGGFPTLAYVKLFKEARQQGVKVLLDGQGMDEQLAGYDYYQVDKNISMNTGPVQGSTTSVTLPDCLDRDFKDRVVAKQVPHLFKDQLRNLQYRDMFYSKIPRALRFNDRASMMESCELREPFLCHRLVEKGFQQPKEWKIADGKGKWLLREIAKELLPNDVREAPKRPVQTPQREWLQRELAPWAEDCIEKGLYGWGEQWFEKDKVRTAWKTFRENGRDNSFPFWQWINLGLMQK